MTTPRDAFLNRVRQAVAEGNRAGTAPPLPARGNIGYQGAGSDLVLRFSEQLAAAGGTAHLVSGAEEAASRILELLRDRNADLVLLGRGAYVDPLNLAVRLREHGIGVLLADEVAPAQRDLLYTPQVGISGVAHLVAETGSVVVASRPDDPRSVSLLPPVHIAVASRQQLLPDLFDLFDALSIKDEDNEMPSCLCLVTGPSKTGDIELKLVTGVHGPGEIHVILMAV